MSEAPRPPLWRMSSRDTANSGRARPRCILAAGVNAADGAPRDENRTARSARGGYRPDWLSRFRPNPSNHGKRPAVGGDDQGWVTHVMVWPEFVLTAFSHTRPSLATQQLTGRGLVAAAISSTVRPPRAGSCILIDGATREKRFRGRAVDQITYLLSQGLQCRSDCARGL
jgi:hypothetical protein